MKSAAREAVMAGVRAACKAKLGNALEAESLSRLPREGGCGEEGVAVAGGEPAPPREESRLSHWLCERFSNELGALDGKAHIAGSLETAAGVVASVLASRKIGHLALGPGAMTASVAAKLEGRAQHQEIVKTLDWKAEASLLAEIPAGLVEAKAGIADTGTIILDTEEQLLASLLPPLLIALLPADRVAASTSEALALLSDRWMAGGRLTLVTGPSRTADIEKKLVLGVHGPKDLVVVIVPNCLAGPAQ